MLSGIFKKESVSIFDNLTGASCKIDVSSEYKSQIDMIGLTEKDLEVLVRMAPYVKDSIELAVQSFYDTVQKKTLLKNIIAQHSHVDRLKITIQKHLSDLFNGVIDHEYIRQRNIIAHVHVKIGLPTKWYIASFQILIQSLLRIIQSHIHTLEEYQLAQEAINKIFSLEQQLVLEAYEQKTEEIRLKEEEKKNEIEAVLEDATSQLSQKIAKSSHSIKEATNRSHEITKLVEGSSKEITHTEELSKQGSVLLYEQDKKMETIEHAMEQINLEMKELFEISGEIRKIIEFVKEISDQTKLLSLNASIEAARAGEHGRGFTIVANEVRKMAETTKDSTSNINELITKTIEKVEKIYQSLDGAEGLVKEGKGSLEQAMEFFDLILNAVTENKEKNINVLNKVQECEKLLDGANESTLSISNQTEQIRNLAYTLHH